MYFNTHRLRWGKTGMLNDTNVYADRHISLVVYSGGITVMSYVAIFPVSVSVEYLFL